MSPSDDFYALLSSLLQQTAQNPDTPPVIPFKRWPAGSPEQFLLEDLQAALAALQTGNQKHPSEAKEREQRYQSIFETASDGLIINDLETGLVVEANPAACTMHGYARKEFIGMHPTRLIHPDSSHQFAQYIQAVQSHGVYVTLQVHMRRDGSHFYAELSGTVYTDQGRSYLLSVVREVSQRVRSEQRLQQRVEARTREQSTLLEVSQTLASALELQPGLILDQLRVIIDYSHAGLFTVHSLKLK
jgi:PAS domain S-box-containing protein